MNSLKHEAFLVNAIETTRKQIEEVETKMVFAALSERAASAQLEVLTERLENYKETLNAHRGNR